MDIPTSYLLNILITMGIFAILVLSLNLLAGFTGLLSVCHAALFGVGAYAAGIVAVRFSSDLFLLLLVAIVTTVAVASLVAIPSLRLGGDYFVLATLGFQIIITDVLQNSVDLTRGPFGLHGIPRVTVFGMPLQSTELTLVLVAVCLAIVYFLVRRLTRAPFGRVLDGIREDELATETLGKPALRYKVMVFLLAGAIAAVAGVLYADFIRSLTPDSFPIGQSFLLLAIVFLGGGGSLIGSVVATFILLLLPEVLRLVGLPSATAGPIQQIIYGLVLVLMMILRPQGLFGRTRLA